MRKRFAQMTSLLLAAVLLAGCSSAPAQSAPSSSGQAGSSQEQSLYVNVTPLKPLELEDKEAPLVSSSASTSQEVQVPASSGQAPAASSSAQAPIQEEKPAVEQAPAQEEKPAAEQAPAQGEKPAVEQAPVQEPEPNLPEADALSKAPAAVTVGASCEASGEKEKSNNKAVIDYSNTQDGYVMVNFTASTEKRLKVQVKGPSTTYSYNLTPGEWTVFPLSDGNGSYTVGVYENISGNKYSSVLSVSAQVTLKDDFGPFIRPNQYVNYANAPKTVAKAKELASGLSQPLEKVAAIYDYVVSTMSYDYDLAASVKSGYLPDLDKVLAKKSGICFDYAALMTGMLRSQGIPCKLVVGYAGSAYHAWINVWSESTGWINAAIYFDGVAWQRMDPTFASTAKQSEEIMAYIGDGANYSAKYLY